jgi:hypothetical protein
MGIEAILRTESQEVIGSVLDSDMVLSRAARAGDLSATVLLRYLVPWGDAVFNQAQAEDLIGDIRGLAERNPGSPLSQRLLAIRGLAEQLMATTHSYLWFIGD